MEIGSHFLGTQTEHFLNRFEQNQGWSWTQWKYVFCIINFSSLSYHWFHYFCQFLLHNSVVASCSVDDGKRAKKRKLSVTVPPETTGLQFESSHTDEQSFNTVSPLHIFSWLEGPSSTTKKLKVAILLLSGAGRGQFSIWVSEGGCASIFTVMSPEPLISIGVVHHKWLQFTSDDQIEVYHPKLNCFAHRLKFFRGRNIDSVEFTTRIVLPFQDQSNVFQKFNLVWSESSTGVVNVELRGKEDHYGAGSDNSSFEVF